MRTLRWAVVFEFQIVATDPQTAARAGEFRTPHGTVHTPAFMPVGTRGSVKGLTPAQLRDTGTEIILANTYHLALRPGADVVAALGGLHAFAGWDGPILTDSGGYQVASLAALREIDDDGVTFRSHLDGRMLRLDPGGAIEIQERLGADIIMPLDVCPRLPAAPESLRLAVERTLRWAGRSRDAHRRPDQALFGIVQGGLDPDLRAQCLESLRRFDFAGYALGGLAVGESPDEMFSLLRSLGPALPADRPRYLMGVGRPIDLFRAVACGMDLFDCVLPTRNGRNSMAFTTSGVVRLRNEQHRQSGRPLDETCGCYACRHFSRGYLRHLFLADEMLGPILVSLHNVAYYQALMARIREALAGGRLDRLLAEQEAGAVRQNAD